MSAARHSLPLAGWRVLIPRPAGQADEFAAILDHRGALPWHIPLIEIIPMTHSPEMREAVHALAAGDHHWVVLTSAAALTALRRTADALGARLSVGGDTRIAVVGSATARAVSTYGLRVDLQPAEPGSGAALAAAWPAEAPGTSVLLPRSNRASAELPDALRATGHRVVEVCAYRTEAVPIPAVTRHAIRSGHADAVLLTSPSTARALAAVGISPNTLLIAIGEPTARTLRDLGLPTHGVATHPSAAGMVDALESAAAARPRSNDGMRRGTTLR